jgi:cytochrome P450 family 103
MNTALPHTIGSEPPSLTVEQLDADPHGVFRHYRHLTPVIKRGYVGYLAIRAADLEPLAFDARTRQVETELLAARGVLSGPLFDQWSNSMLFSNGIEHRRRRAPLSRHFGFKVIEDLRPRIRAVAEGIIDAHLPAGELDFIEDFAAHIPACIISEMLGIPASDIPYFTRLVYSASRALTPAFARDDVASVEGSTGELMEYVRKMLRAPGSTQNNFMATYLASVNETDNLTAAEIISQIVSVIIGGSDTTRGAIAMQVALLLQHREQWNALCADRTLIQGAVSEALRFEPVVGSIPRYVVEDIEIDGYLVPRNSLLSLSTLSAMRDPALYREPDRFNIQRTDHPRRHLVFALGVHRCLGEVLARAELEESLAAVAARLPQLELDGKPPTLHGHGGIRRIDGMRVKWVQG